jgi:hypothetical protein
MLASGTSSDQMIIWGLAADLETISRWRSASWQLGSWLRCRLVSSHHIALTLSNAVATSRLIPGHPAASREGSSGSLEDLWKTGNGNILHPTCCIRAHAGRPPDAPEKVIDAIFGAIPTTSRDHPIHNRHMGTRVVHGDRSIHNFQASTLFHSSPVHASTLSHL